MCARRGKQEREQGEDVLGSRSIKAARACILKEVKEVIMALLTRKAIDVCLATA